MNLERAKAYDDNLGSGNRAEQARIGQKAELDNQLEIVQWAIEKCERQRRGTTADGQKVVFEDEPRVFVDLQDGKGERELRLNELIEIKKRLLDTRDF